MPRILIVSLVRSMQTIPQSAAFTPFRTPNPAISHFVVLSLNPEYSENIWKVFITSKTDPLFFQKKIVSSA